MMNRPRLCIEKNLVRVFFSLFLLANLCACEIDNPWHELHGVEFTNDYPLVIAIAPNGMKILDFAYAEEGKNKIEPFSVKNLEVKQRKLKVVKVSVKQGISSRYACTLTGDLPFDNVVMNCASVELMIGCHPYTKFRNMIGQSFRFSDKTGVISWLPNGELGLDFEDKNYKINNERIIKRLPDTTRYKLVDIVFNEPPDARHTCFVSTDGIDRVRMPCHRLPESVYPLNDGLFTLYFKKRCFFR